MNLRNIRLCIFKSLVVVVFFTFVGTAHATKYIDVSAESVSCGTTYTAGTRTIDGTSMSSSSPPDVLANTDIKCSPLTAPGGTHYIEWDVPTVITGSDPHGIGPDWTPAAAPISLVPGTTYYLASYWRFERIAGQALWDDFNFDFDKLIEMDGTNFRWIILAGWNGDMTGAANRFTFSLYGSDAVNPSQCGEPGNWHYYSHRISPYSPSSPLYSDYEQWIPVVMGITANSGATPGHLYLWVNGTMVIDKSCVNTTEGAADIGVVKMSGTVGQPGYNTPHHKRQMDKLMLTNDWNDIVTGGYVSGGDTTPPAAPTGLGVE